MRTKFGTHLDTLVEVKLKTDKIGDGEPGAKSRSLKAHQPMIEQTCKSQYDGLIYVPHLSITPSLFSDFLKRAGASHERPKESVEAIGKTEFLASELDAIRAALAPFKGIYVAVRSDECTAGGNGLWHSGFMLADDSPEAASKASGIVQEILQSEFSPAVIAFKRRVGLPMGATPGVLFMPLIGSDFSSSGVRGLFMTPHHANVLTMFRENEALVSVGLGIGGANNYGAATLLSHGLEFAAPTFSPVHEATARLLLRGDLTRPGSTMHTPDAPFMDFLLQTLGRLARKALGELKAPLEDFTRLAGKPKYLELAMVPEPHVIQCADVRLDEVSEPDVAEGQIILRAGPNHTAFAANVSGRGVVEADAVVYLEHVSDMLSIADLNAQLSNYVLILNTGFSFLQASPDFSEYSNAAAIVFTDERPFYTAATHFNGALREAGIPVIAGDLSHNFLMDLRSGKICRRKLLVYANDAKEEAFVATMD